MPKDEYWFDVRISGALAEAVDELDVLYGETNQEAVRTLLRRELIRLLEAKREVR